MASVGEDIAREILLKLPTRDLVRSSCVCKLWRDVVRDPAFCTLHGNACHVVSGAGIEAESLVVPEFGGRGVGLEMTVLNGTSWKAMCRFTELAPGYSPINACNGLLLLGSGVPDWPVYVCNPVTGEKLKIPAPPEAIEQVQRRTYALGFSPSTRLYKLFCLSFPRTAGWEETQDCYLEVCTLGGASDRKWRRHKNFHADYKLRPPPPVLVDGMLYVVIEGPLNYGARDMMLVIDVTSEEHDTYWLPEEISGLHAAAVYAFNLSGQLCVAIRAIGRRRVNFWVMLSLQGKRMKWRTPDWERRYTFYLDADHGEYGDKPCCAWLDCRDGMLCYRFGDPVYKYDTAKKRSKHRIQLPEAPFASPEDQHQRWNAYGGYRPSLLSPHVAFASPSSLLQQHREKQERYEHTLSHALGCQHPSKKRSSTCPSNCSNNHHGAKRIRSSQPHN